MVKGLAGAQPTNSTCYVDDSDSFDALPLRLRIDEMRDIVAVLALAVSKQSTPHAASAVNVTVPRGDSAGPARLSGHIDQWTVAVQGPRFCAN
jgi:hypothetical protein